MTIVKAHDVDRLVKTGPLTVKAFLLFGPDQGRVSDLARIIVNHVAGSLDDPFRVTNLDDAGLADDPSRLRDEAQALSMIGGQRAIRVTGAGAGFTKAAELHLAEPIGDGVIVAEAGELSKSAKLRKLFEKSADAAAIACYRDNAADIRGLIDDALARHNLKIEPAARNHLAAMLGSDRLVSRSELEKLALYCHGAAQVTADDVNAVCGDASALSLDAIVDNAFEGDAAGACAMFSRQNLAGGGANPVLNALLQHAIRLRALMNASAARGIDGAIRAATPPIFYQRHKRIAGQLKLWRGERLTVVCDQLMSATCQARLLPDLDAQICERAIIAIATANHGRRGPRPEGASTVFA